MEQSTGGSDSNRPEQSEEKRDDDCMSSLGFSLVQG